MSWRNVILAILAAWFVIAAFAFNPLHSLSYQLTVLIVGGLTLIMAVWALFDRHRRRWRHWTMGVFGIFLGLSVWLFGFIGSLGLFWLSLIAGALILVFSLAELTR